MLRSGPLSQRIRIETPTGAQNNTGESVDTWSTLCHCWASVTPLVGREAFRMAQVAPQVTHMVRMRYQEGINSTLNPKMRIVLNSRYLNIESVKNIEENGEQLEVACVEAV